MAKQKNNSKPADLGSYVWRGGQRISLEKVEDRFTLMPPNAEQLAKLRNAPGIREIVPVTNQVYKVETSLTDRDSAMEMVRSPVFNAVAHHAYRPAGTEGTIYYLTDQIIVSFDSKVKPEQIDTVLE